MRCSEDTPLGGQFEVRGLCDVFGRFFEGMGDLEELCANDLRGYVIGVADKW